MSCLRRVIALGFFDGVHLGHRMLLARTRERAAELGATPAVISFDAHPDEVVFHRPVRLLGTTAERRELIARVGGIEDILLLHFDDRMMRMPWEVFLQSLTDELGAVHLVMGEDFSCGYRGEGTAERLCARCDELGIGHDVIAQMSLDGVVVSSTYIRELISDGRMEEAARYLGHPHSISDTVSLGFKIGRTIGAPTINTRIPAGVIVPRFGVYATRVYLQDGAHLSVTNVGVRPTFGGGEDVTVESHILDFQGDLYGKEVRIEFYHFLRPEQRFETVEALRLQIERDKDSVRRYFSALG